MNIHTMLSTTFAQVLPNAWSTELPPKPTWPAIVYTVGVEPEKGWVLGGGYDQNMVQVTIYSRSRVELTQLQKQVVASMESLPGYMGDEDHGDAPYEDDPQVYAYVMNFVVRTRREE